MDRVPSDPPHALPAPSGPPPPGSRTVTTDDGVPLHVEFDGKLEAPLTVVFSHGFTARLVEWEFQRAALRDRARLVLWDQRGHGRSGWTKLTSATIWARSSTPSRRPAPSSWSGTRWAA
jgi:pimeloyl-ACP methyl ester carboxylesterase